MKTEYDITKLYVGLVARQSEVDCEYDNCGFITDASWHYADIRAQIFIKTPFGFKHITTGELYKFATHKTGGKMVIAYKSMEKLTRHDPELIRAYCKKTKTKIIKVEEEGKVDIGVLERYYNTPKKLGKLMMPHIKEECKQEYQEFLDEC